MRPVLTLALKDLRLVLRDKFALFWLFAFPLMYALFFGSLFGDDDDGARSRISIAVVDEDASEASAGLVERLAEHESLRVEREGEGEDAPPRVDTLEEARDGVRLGKQVAYLRILPGYGDSPFRLFGAEGEGAAIEVGIDPARKAEAGMLQGVLMDALFGGLAESWTDKESLIDQIQVGKNEIEQAGDLGPAQKVILGTFMNALTTFIEDVDADVLAEGPGGGGGIGSEDMVDVVEVTRDRHGEPQSAFEITFPTAMIWGLMTAALTFAISLVRERTQGTLLRLRIAPITSTQLLAGKALGCFAMCQIVMVFLMGFGYLALGVRFGSVPLLALSMACTGVCFTGLMMTASVMGKTEQAVAGASWGAMMPFAMIGGGMIPLIAMPPWLLALSDFSPFKWGIYSMEGAVWRGFGLAEMLGPCAILLVLGLVFFGFGVWVFRRIE